MHRSIHFIVLSMFLIIATFASIDFVSEEAEAVGQPVVTIKFLEGQEKQKADVKPGQHGTVTFPGTVEARIPAGSNIQDVVVSLQGSTNLGWSAVVNPTTIQVEPGGTATFSVTVSVPPETSYTIQDTLVLTGTARSFPGAGAYNIAPIQGTILVNQFYKFTILCDKPYKQVRPTEQLGFTLRIWNYGNGRDTFTIAIPNFNKLSSEGWTVNLGQYNVEVPEKSQEQVPITLQTPVKFNHWINAVTYIKVEVSSEQQMQIEGQAYPKEYPLAVRQRGFSLPGFDPLLIIISFAFITIFMSRGHQISQERKKKRARKRGKSGRPLRKLKNK